MYTSISSSWKPTPHNKRMECYCRDPPSFLHGPKIARSRKWYSQAGDTVATCTVRALATCLCELDRCLRLISPSVFVGAAVSFTAGSKQHPLSLLRVRATGVTPPVFLSSLGAAHQPSGNEISGKSSRKVLASSAPHCALTHRCVGNLFRFQSPSPRAEPALHMSSESSIGQAPCIAADLVQ
jgi:hypothetical protein